ncbi:MAG: Na-K-Cl cotransporter [Cyclobacteriaceae bacterium]
MKNPFLKKGNDNESVIPAVKTGFGTFGGVFTPSILTILGVIMYLRFGWVVGNVGLIGTLIIVTLASSITFLTALSVAAIATDQRVRSGGAYYMISRSLGIEAGGAIGIPLYLAQALSVALYTVGFAESMVSVFPALDIKMVGLITTVGIATLAIVSAQVAIKAQYFIMFGIGLSLISFILGSPIEETTIELWGASDRNSEGFWVVFAVFFPAVTGIMAGINMSGDLKNPSKSIPIGTFAAIGVGYVIYMTLPIILAQRANALTLIADPMIMRKMSYWGDAILFGVWGATLSSAVGSILGAPRVLQALVRDRILPPWLDWLGYGSGTDDSPRFGTIFTMVIALIAVYLGNLNIIAPILTMFFLTTYGILNAVAGIEGFLNSPSFRPSFKVHWFFSLLGTLGCLGVMFLINALATGLAFVFIIAIFFWIQSKEMKTAWGDVRRGIWMALIRIGLLNLRRTKATKSWRPSPLVLSGAPTTRWHLIDFASSIIHNRGLLTVATVLSSSGLTSKRRKKMESNIEDFLNKKGKQGFARVILAKDTFKGAVEFVRSYGYGTLIPNTIILGDSENSAVRKNYCEMIAQFHELNRNVVIVRDNPEKGFGNRKQIDLWWGGLKANGGLLLILAYLLQSTRSWYGSNVNIKMMVSDEKAGRDARNNLSAVITKLRTGAKLEIIVAKGRTFEEVLHESSSKADLIFMGMAVPDENFEVYYQNIQKRIQNLPTTILALAAEGISFGEVLMQQDEFRDD